MNGKHCVRETLAPVRPVAPRIVATSPMKATPPLVSIIVVNYRTRELTLECLRSVARETENFDYEILLVDNASNDGLIEAVAGEMPDVRRIPLTENVGFARGNNIAAEQARGKYLLLLNSDTLILDRAIDRLLAFAAERPAAKIWGGRTLLGDRTLDPGSCWRRMTLWSVFCRTFGLAAAFPNSKLFNAEAYGGWDRSTVREVDIVTGCFLLIETELWRKLGGFDPRFFMYGEEADLCLRAAAARRQAGFDARGHDHSLRRRFRAARDREDGAPADRQGRAHQALLPAGRAAGSDCCCSRCGRSSGPSARSCRRRSRATAPAQQRRGPAGKFGSGARSGASDCAESTRAANGRLRLLRRRGVPGVSRPPTPGHAGSRTSSSSQVSLRNLRYCSARSRRRAGPAAARRRRRSRTASLATSRLSLQPSTSPSGR